MRADRRTVASDLEKPGGEGSWRYLEEPSKDAKSNVFDGIVVEVNESGPGSVSVFLPRPRGRGIHHHVRDYSSR